MARKPIIAVIGGNKASPEILKAAEHIGRAVVRADAVLLTGSQPIKGQDVKQAAMLGAVSSTMPAPGHVRFIGVLPKRELPQYDLEPTTQRLIQTKSSSGRRNPINGMTADAAIVFPGGSGTLAELAFAIVAGRPRLFIGAVAALCAALPQQRFRELLEEGFGFLADRSIVDRQQITTELQALERKVDACLSAAEDKTCIAAVDAAMARSVVEAAIALIPANVLDLESGYPGLSFDDKTKFESWLSCMP
jgi:predicted Rossmann-fold nucleotide-binding protein